jgi:outer membrane protein OmpA-like peptidoglycan-associated protein
VSRALEVGALVFAAMIASADAWAGDARVFEPSDSIDAHEITRIFSVTPTRKPDLAGGNLPRTRGIRKAAGAGEPDTPAIALRIQFALDSASIPSAALKQLDAVARGLHALGGQPHIVVEGHTDVSGSDAYNDALSMRRARAVRDYLVSRGVRAGWLEPRGLGHSALLDKNAPLAPENRRVELRRIS